MTKLLTATLLVLLSVKTVAAGDRMPWRIVDLDQPNALETLQRTNPAHHQKIQRIIDRLDRQPDADVPRWLQVTFHAQFVTYGPIWLTSFPPQTQLGFMLDGTYYHGLVTLWGYGRPVRRVSSP